MTGRKAVLEIMLFNNLSNSFSFTDVIGKVRILYFYVNVVLTKQWMDLKLTKT